MSLQTTIYLVVGITFALYIGIAIWSRAKSTSDFYVAGGNVHPITNGMATAAGWMSAASFISMAGMISFMGYGGSVFLMGWTGGFVLLAMFLAPYLRKFGKFTVPQFIRDRFYSKSASAVAVICLLVASLTYIVGQMTGVGVAFSRFLGVSSSNGIFIGMAVVFAYAVFGGMKGITYAQVAQYVVLIMAYTIPAIFISLQLTGNPIPQLGLGSKMVGSSTELLARLNQIVTDLGFNEYTTTGTGSKLNMVLFTLSLMIGTAGLPHVIMRFFTVSTVSAARKSALWALVFIALLYTTAPAVAAMARYNLHTTVNSGIEQSADIFAEESSLKGDERPDWMKRWENTGLLAWEDKNNDGRIQYYNDETEDASVLASASEAGWEGNELTVNNDIIVLANPEIAMLPNWIIALVAAGGLAAALSTAGGLLMAISSAISHDLVKNIFAPKITDKQELLVGKIAMALSVVFAGWLGLNPPGFAAGTVALAFGIAASTLFPALMLGIFSIKMNKYGAISGMLTGLFITLFYVFAHKGIFFIQGTQYTDAFGGPNFFFGISPEAFGAVGAFVNFIVAIVVSKFTKDPPLEVQELVQAVRIPRTAKAKGTE
ncbi:MAG: cation acetate symporter [Clostridiales bacterium]|nr:cation acetate symporter [Clostridiales bacterium]